MKNKTTPKRSKATTFNMFVLEQGSTRLEVIEAPNRDNVWLTNFDGEGMEISKDKISEEFDRFINDLFEKYM